MPQRYNLAYFILASIVALVLTPLMVGAAPQAQIAFASERDGNRQIYVMDTDGVRQTRRLTSNRHNDINPAWSNPAFAVGPTGKTLTIWGWLKQSVR